MSAEIDTFILKAKNAGAEVELFSSPEDAARFLEAFFEKNALKSAYISERLAGDRRFAAMRPYLEAGPPEKAMWVGAGLVEADYGVAETGTLVHFDMGDDEKNAWTLPNICVCLLDREKIVPDLEAIAPQVAGHLARTGSPAPQVSLVTGPSRTADIENQLTIGVHGPSRLIILLI